METVRLRLVLDKALSRSHKTEGLKRCWILLKPHLKTISDLSSFLLHAFDLQNACPIGLVLSMDGFTLPPFESTCIFKDKDIIRVKKKSETSSEITEVANGVGCLELVEIVEKPSEPIGMKLLANEEFGSEPEGDAPKETEDVLHVEITTPEVRTNSKKRRAAKELRSSNSKRKKNKSAVAEKCKVVSGDVKNVVPGLQNGTLSGAKKSPCHMEQEQKYDMPRIPEQRMKRVGLFAAYKDCMTRSSDAIRFSQPQVIANGSEDTSCTPSGTKKLPSRSARRKKAKRQWLRERIKAEKKEKELLEKASQQSSKRDSNKSSEGPSEEGNHEVSEEIRENNENQPKEEHQQPGPDSDADDDIVPIVIRPGHIRFELLSKVGTVQTAQQYQIPLETFQWNGTSSKNKCQKRGKEKVASCKRNDYRSVSQECSRTLTIKEKALVHHPINFDKLPPYTTSLPKKGDVIAYRLIELSSCWTPELSSYRVGKISRYDVASNIVILLPVLGYPLILEEKADGERSNLQEEKSTYRKDKSLEIKFSSLIDVRLVNQNSAKTIRQLPQEEDNWSKAVRAQLTEEDNWSKAARAQLSQEDNWIKALRSSVTCPTMASFITQNGF